MIKTSLDIQRHFSRLELEVWRAELGGTVLNSSWRLRRSHGEFKASLEMLSQERIYQTKNVFISYQEDVTHFLHYIFFSFYFLYLYWFSFYSKQNQQPSTLDSTLCLGTLPSSKPDL